MSPRPAPWSCWAWVMQAAKAMEADEFPSDRSIEALFAIFLDHIFVHLPIVDRDHCTPLLVLQRSPALFNASKPCRSCPRPVNANGDHQSLLHLGQVLPEIGRAHV